MENKDRFQLRKYDDRRFGIYDLENNEFIQVGFLEDMREALKGFQSGKVTKDIHKDEEVEEGGFKNTMSNTEVVAENKEVKTESYEVWQKYYEDGRIITEFVQDFDDYEKAQKFADGLNQDPDCEAWVKDLEENKEIKTEATGTDIAVKAIMAYGTKGKPLDEEWLNNEIQLLIKNTMPLYDAVVNSKRPAHSIAYDALIMAINEKVEGHGDLTSKQIQAGFKNMGIDYKEVIKPSVEFVEQERKDLKEESKTLKTEAKSLKEFTTAFNFEAFSDYMKKEILKFYPNAKFELDYNGGGHYLRVYLGDKESTKFTIEAFINNNDDGTLDDGAINVGMPFLLNLFSEEDYNTISKNWTGNSGWAHFNMNDIDGALEMIKFMCTHTNLTESLENKNIKTEAVTVDGMKDIIQNAKEMFQINGAIHTMGFADPQLSNDLRIKFNNLRAQNKDINTIKNDLINCIPVTESVNVKKYVLTIKHDGGTVNITTTASSKEQAIKQVCNSEKCPKSAILDIKELDLENKKIKTEDTEDWETDLQPQLSDNDEYTSDKEDELSNLHNNNESILESLQDLVGQEMSATELNVTLQNRFARYNELFILKGDLYNKDLDETQELVITDEDVFYSVFYDIVDVESGIIKVVDVDERY